MLKYVSKFAMDMLPSVIATITGAYIVHHYINKPPAADAPVAAAVSSADPKAGIEKADIKKADIKKAGTRNDAKPSETSADVGRSPVPGVTAKGISEKGMFETRAAEAPAIAEKPQEKPAEKSADKPAETASIPADTRRHQPQSREKTAARAVPAPVQPVPVVAAPATAPTAEAAVTEEHRDANDLARAAIERLRGTGDTSPRVQETARTPDAPRVVSAPAVMAPVVSAPMVRPLPPPILVSAPPAQPFDPATGSAQTNDPSRPTPPADIPPASRPLDLRAEAVEPQKREHTNVAEDMLLAAKSAKEDMLLAAKSVFHSVLPK
jgi:hypothetical protein